MASMLRLCRPFRRQQYGKFPSVSVNNAGTIVEVYQPHILSDTIYYEVGALNGERINMSEDQTFLDKGRYPKIAINNNNRVIEVHEGRVHRYIYYHYGTVDINNRTIAWNDHPRVYELCWGRFPSVAVHGNRVVVTYDRAYGSYTSYYCIGNFNEDGTDIQWEQLGNPGNRKLFDSHDVTETSVAINEHNVVVAGRGWTSIVCRVGKFQANTIQFATEILFNHLGYCPTVCLDDDGYIIMVWQSTTLRKLNYETASIPNRVRPSITWTQHPSAGSYDSGYNPTIAISPDGKKVLEEHETSYALYRCSLYYHTGGLEKPRT